MLAPLFFEGAGKGMKSDRTLCDVRIRSNDSAYLVVSQFEISLFLFPSPSTSRRLASGKTGEVGIGTIF